MRWVLEVDAGVVFASHSLLWYSVNWSSSRHLSRCMQCLHTYIFYLKDIFERALKASIKDLGHYFPAMCNEPSWTLFVDGGNCNVKTNAWADLQASELSWKEFLDVIFLLLLLPPSTPPPWDNCLWQGVTEERIGNGINWTEGSLLLQKAAVSVAHPSSLSKTTNW